MDAVIEELMGKIGVSFLKEDEEWRLPGLSYANDLFLCQGSEEYLKVMVGHFIEVFRKRDLKVNSVKSKVIMLGVEEE